MYIYEVYSSDIIVYIEDYIEAIIAILILYILTLIGSIGE